MHDTRADTPTRSRNFSGRQLAMQPTRWPDELDWSDFDEMTPKSARETSPYKEGDVIPFWDGFKVREGLIVGVGCGWFVLGGRAPTLRR